jgi:glycosyltransferase involved in cell wall biosynthesis
MRIGFLLGGFTGIGGIARVTNIILKDFSDNSDHELFTITFVKDGKNQNYEIPDNVYRFHLFDKRISMSKAMLLKGAVKKLKNIIKKNNLDVIVAAGVLYYPLARLAVKGTNCRFIAWEHINPHTVSDYRFQAWGRKNARKASHSIVISKTGYDYYRDNLKIDKSKLSLIYNPIDPKIDMNKMYNAESKQIISVGRLSYQKNFQSAIRIAAQVFAKRPDWTWHIYGEGEEREQIIQLINDLNLQDKVILKGSVKNLYELYGNYSFLVMTSRYEGFPMSLLEAGASGLPLVSFDIQTGPNEIIEDGKTGYLIEEKNEELMVDRIITLIDSENLRSFMSENVKKSMSRFSIKTIRKQWFAMLK